MIWADALGVGQARVRPGLAASVDLLDARRRSNTLLRVQASPVPTQTFLPRLYSERRAAGWADDCPKTSQDDCACAIDCTGYEHHTQSLAHVMNADLGLVRRSVHRRLVTFLSTSSARRGLEAAAACSYSGTKYQRNGRLYHGLFDAEDAVAPEKDGL